MTSPGEVVQAVRDRAPLVHCITAAVSMNLVADALNASGARPMMTETQQEAPVITGAAEALLVNLGTLSTDGASGILPTVAESTAAGHPFVLDPAAIGRAPLRTCLAIRLLGLGPAVVRGNASEVLVLDGASAGGRGPDSVADVDDAAAAARRVALERGTVVAVSGATDLITDGHREVRLSNGHPLLTAVTGTGCSLGALTAACCAVAEPFDAAVAATAWLTVAAERAALGSRGPGSFRTALLDELYALTPADLEETLRWS